MYSVGLCLKRFHLKILEFAYTLRSFASRITSQACSSYGFSASYALVSEATDSAYYSSGIGESVKTNRRKSYTKCDLFKRLEKP
jgi:hypothetical protein